MRLCYTEYLEKSSLPQRDGCLSHRKEVDGLFRLARFLKDYKRQVILGPIFKLMEAIFEVIVPVVMASLIDVGIQSGDRGYILKMGGLLVLLGVVGLACALTCQFFAAQASQGVGTQLRSQLFAHINTLSHSEIDRLGTPSLITRITSDVNQVQVAVAMLIRLAVRAPFLVIGSTVMAMLLDLKLSLVFVVVIPLVALALYLVMSHSIPFFKVIQKKLDRISLITRENLSGVRVIRAFSKQDAEQRRFEQASDDLKDTAVRVGKISALLSPVTSVLMNLGIIAVLWFGGWRVNAGHLTQGEIVAFVNYITQMLLALIVVADLVVIFTKSAASAARINEIFDTRPSVSDAGNSLQAPPEESAARIRFEDVAFRYEGAGADSLRHLTVEIGPRETVGVIGGTGAGKSTLVNLIPRFYDVTQGRLLMDGIDVKRYPFRQLRDKIGLVPQQAMLFSGTVRENLRWRKADATDEEIWRALEIAQAKEFVEKLENGLDSFILQGGKNLSGGQKQRLTIARALVGAPQILILDDSASALDFATDAALRQALSRYEGDCAVILVSQRVNTVKNADKIIVLDDGEPAGIGTHEELYASCQIYREICLSQMSEEEARR